MRSFLHCLLVAAAFCPSIALAGELTVDFLDVGQGDAMLIRAGGKAVLIDAGIKRANVAAQLAALDVTSLDLAIVSHPHADHMGGMEQVLRSIPVGMYIDNGMPHTTQTYAKLMIAVEELGIPYRTGRTGMELKLGDEAVINVILPGDTLLRNTRSDLNSNSVVVILTHGEMDFLFTGDAEEPTEGLITRQNLPSIDVLKVAHHGSDHSSSTSFLRTVNPPIAVISCGEDNRYGHPAPEALERLGSAGAMVYRTDQSGHIRAISDGTTVEILELGNFTGITVEPRAMRQIGAPSISASALDLHNRPSLQTTAEPTAPTEPTAPAETSTTGLSLSGVRVVPVEPPLTPKERRKRERQERRDARRQ